MDRTHMPAISTACDGYLAFAHLLPAAWAAKVALDPAQQAVDVVFIDGVCIQV